MHLKDLLPAEIIRLLIPILDVEEEVQTLFCMQNNAIPSPILRQDSSKVFFEIQGDAKQVVISQDLSALSRRGVTGTVVWNSSLVFVSFLNQMKMYKFPWIRNVVELGTGNGFVAVALKLCAGVDKIVCTDNVMASLQLSRKNVIANVGTDEGYEFVELDWQDWRQGSFLNNLPKSAEEVDLIIACDVLYNESIVPSLVETIQRLSDVWKCPWMIVQELRSDDVHRLFLELLEKEMRLGRLFRMPLVSGVTVDACFSAKFVVYIHTPIE
jgi:hypothetical protein